MKPPERRALPEAPLRTRAGGVALLVSCLATPASTAPAPLLTDSVVVVRAVRGFQGYFEWSPGEYWYNPDRVRGGLFLTCGAVIDLRGLAREAHVRPSMPMADGDVFVLTTLRSVHGGGDAWIRFTLAGEGSIPMMHELPAEIVAEDGAMNLALVRVRGLPDAPRGLRVAPATALCAGQEVLHLHAWDWMPHAWPDEIWKVGHLFPGDVPDPFWASELPLAYVRSGLVEQMSGDPLLDPATHQLVGLAANGQRLVGGPNNEQIWPGIQYVIASRYVRSFLLAALVGRAGLHGALDAAPRLAPVTPDLARALALPRSEGQLVMEDTDVGGGEPTFLQGDVLLAAEGRRLGPGGVHLGEVVFEAEPDTSIRVEGLRNGEPFAVTMPVRRRPASWGASVGHLTFAGAWFQDLPEAFRRSGQGASVAVAHVEPGSPAAAAQVRFRAVVHEVFGAGVVRQIATVAELRSALEEVRGAPASGGEVGFRLSDYWYPEIMAWTSVVRLPSALPSDATDGAPQR